MKKLFIDPEVKSVELTPANNVMVDLARSLNVMEKTKTFADTVSTDYQNWQGRR